MWAPARARPSPSTHHPLPPSLSLPLTPSGAVISTVLAPTSAQLVDRHVPPDSRNDLCIARRASSSAPANTPRKKDCSPASPSAASSSAAASFSTAAQSTFLGAEDG